MTFVRRSSKRCLISVTAAATGRASSRWRKPARGMAAGAPVLPGPPSPAPRRARCRGARRCGNRFCVRRARLRPRQGHRRAASGGSDAEYSRERSARDVLLVPRRSSAGQELGVRRRAADPAWWWPGQRKAAPRLRRATPHTRGSRAPAIRDRLGRRVRPRPAASRQHVPRPPTGEIQVRKGDRLVPLRWASDLKRLEARLDKSRVVAAGERVEAAEVQGVRAL